jgi:hypothetical protein
MAQVFAVRRLVPMLVLLLAGSSGAFAGNTILIDGFESGDSCAWGFGPSTCPGFEIRTPEVEVGGGEAKTFCYYFHTPNTATLGIHRFVATFGANVHHAILYATYDVDWDSADRMPPGTLYEGACGFADHTASGTTAAWLFAAYDPPAELVLPADDGFGDPLAIEIVAGQAGFLQFYVVNPDLDPVTTAVRIGAGALATVAYTTTASYLTYNSSLNIPAMAVGYPQTQTCATPAGVEFWWFSTHTHQLAVESELRDGGSTLVTSTDWQHPAVLSYAAPPYYDFSTALTYECSYNNPNPAPVGSGNSEATDENCIGVGYFFPAARPMYCINSIGPL